MQEENQQRTLALLISIYWIATSIKIFSQTGFVNTASISISLMGMLAVGVPITVFSRISRFSASFRAQIIVISFFLIDLFFAYSSGRFVLTPLFIAAITIATTPLHDRRVIAVCGISGNFLCILFWLIFPNIATGTISSGNMVRLILLMDAVIVFSFIIVDWIEKRIKISAKIAEEAGEASNAKGQFLASVSHGIRTPMNAIFGTAEIILAAPEGSDIKKLKEKVYQTKSAGYELLALINDILDITKIEQGKMELVEMPYNATDLFADIEGFLIGKLADKSVIMRSKYDFTISEILVGDDVRIKQICINLLSNAVKYTSKGCIEFTVEQTMAETGVNMSITVSDTGIGIREQDIDNIFKDYQKIYTDKSKGLDGMGFGLAITKSLVDLMGGTITVKSKYGKGSVFTVIIPQKISYTLVSNEKYSSKTGKVKITGANVLVVDDNSTNIQVIKGILRSYNIDIDSALSGFEAVEKVSVKKYDIIFMDYLMPGMDGLESVRAIRALKANNSQNVPIVMLTAKCDKSLEEYLTNNGIDGYLTKPISMVELERVLKRFFMLNIKEGVYEASDESCTGTSGIWLADIDVEKGIENCGGTMDMLMDVLHVFQSSGGAQIQTIRDAFNHGDISRVAVEAHALKSVSRGIGVEYLADLAEDVETAAKRKDMDLLGEYIGSMLAEYQRVLNDVDRIAGIPVGDDEKPVCPFTAAELIQRLESVISACGNYNFADANDVMEELLSYSYDKDTAKKLIAIKDDLSQFSYITTISASQSLIDELKQGKHIY